MDALPLDLVDPSGSSAGKVAALRPRPRQLLRLVLCAASSDWSIIDDCLVAAGPRQRLGTGHCTCARKRAAAVGKWEWGGGGARKRMQGWASWGAVRRGGGFINLT